MRVLEPGHVYELDHLDGPNKQRLVFVNRETAPHEGTQTQEVLRANIDAIECLIDRTNHCDSCLRWEGNDRIIKALSEAQRQLRLALLFHEQRALERKMAKGDLKPEDALTDKDGHFYTPPVRNPALEKRVAEVATVSVGKYPEPEPRGYVTLHLLEPMGHRCVKCGLVMDLTAEDRRKRGPAQWTRYLDDWQKPQPHHRRCTGDRDG